MSDSNKDALMLDNEKIITTCPNYGCDITEANNAGNGFCIDCTRNENID